MPLALCKTPLLSRSKSRHPVVHSRLSSKTCIDRLVYRSKNSTSNRSANDLLLPNETLPALDQWDRTSQPPTYVSHGAPWDSSFDISQTVGDDHGLLREVALISTGTAYGCRVSDAENTTALTFLGPVIQTGKASPRALHSFTRGEKEDEMLINEHLELSAKSKFAYQLR